jgi:hypothetical protein
MDFVRTIDTTLWARVRKTEKALWDHIVAALGGEWERGWSLRWTADPQITVEELAEELAYGRD